MRKLPLLLLPFLLFLAGCLSPEEQLVGKWRGKLEVTREVTQSPMGQMAGGLSNYIQPQLDLRPDKTFTLSLSVAPIDGTWKLQGDQIILTPKTVMGMTTQDAKQQAEKAMVKAQSKSPVPLPFVMGSLPTMSEMRANLDQKNQKITLDPASGTLLAGFGKIVFTKI